MTLNEFLRKYFAAISKGGLREKVGKSMGISKSNFSDFLNGKKEKGLTLEHLANHLQKLDPQLSVALQKLAMAARDLENQGNINADLVDEAKEMLEVGGRVLIPREQYQALKDMMAKLERSVGK